MFLTFNMGIGYVLVLPDSVESLAIKLLEEAGEEVVHLGEIVQGAEKVTMGGLL